MGRARAASDGRQGFTLIELLVTIAIIAILAAILFPVFSRARAYSQKTVCVSNLRQIAMAAHMYAQDFDEMFPLEDNNRNPQMILTGGLWPYTKSRHIFYCPTAGAAWDPGLDDTDANWAQGNISYFYYSFSTLDPLCATYAPRTLTEASDSACWLLSDAFLSGRLGAHGVAQFGNNVVCIGGNCQWITGPPKPKYR